MPVLILILVSLTSFSSLGSPLSKTQTTASIKFETLLQRQDVIWGFDFLPEDRVILTERSGKMLIFNLKTKQTIEVKGLPEIYSAGQAGLLDVRAHPDFKANGQIFFTYSEPLPEKKSTTALGTGILENNQLKGFRKLFNGLGQNENDIHYGSRIEFDQVGHLYISMGDRGERQKAQDLSVHQGKILRLNLDGSVPSDNPFVATNAGRGEIWSFGHRNPQGLTRHPETGDLWEAEMGPRGGDEVNLIEAKKNYGWPIITYGREYYGPKIGETEKTGMEQPVVYWVPSISPSALAFYNGAQFPEWKNNLFLATLSGEHIHRVVLVGRKVQSQEKLLGDLEYRWRSIRTGPDGYLYFGTDEGKFGRIVRK